ncbi:hypothetical protein NUU61_002478 [Penicillium alfredii]|uniref:Integrase zinc-binding domain-containing protein n=1 Tax=Penicillium alfredii TaxID=1506179 RepID=A0A9W9FRK2_9EURO|nr:uncharacterized protein NUU61_002478 [Penicillium alfredii]KAJ5105131.1 hypothetical protein NUU61_002478 [Penicillium alfredii]
MSSFTRRNDGNDSYLMNQQMTIPGTYGPSDGHEFNTNGSGSYHFPQHSFTPYASQFGPPYAQQSNLAPGLQHFQYSSEHPFSSVSSSDEMRLHHPPPQYMPQSRYLQSPRYLPLRDALGETEIESQESRNEGTMLSEPVVPALDGFPDVKEFDQLMQSYVDDLSVKKQDKALIHARRACNIRTVLIDPKDTAVESAQFRFWVKKMFKLQAVGIGTPDVGSSSPSNGRSLIFGPLERYTDESSPPQCRKMICHEGKPVAIREKLFKILTKAHQQCQHGGRDKTSAQVRRIYSWVPKELISRFVKICPTCQVRRGGSRLTPPNSRRGSPRLDMVSRSPKLPSPPTSRRESTFGGQVPLDRSHQDYFGQLHGHNGWLDSHQSLQGRSALNTGVRPFHGPMGNLSHPMASTLDPFATELSVPPSQLSYTTEYVPSHATQRDF